MIRNDSVQFLLENLQVIYPGSISIARKAQDTSTTQYYSISGTAPPYTTMLSLMIYDVN